MILNFRKVLHVWNRFCTDDAKEDHCCRSKPGGGEDKNIVKKIKENNELDNEGKRFILVRFVLKSGVNKI